MPVALQVPQAHPQHLRHLPGKKHDSQTENSHISLNLEFEVSLLERINKNDDDKGDSAPFYNLWEVRDASELRQEAKLIHNEGVQMMALHIQWFE